MKLIGESWKCSLSLAPCTINTQVGMHVRQVRSGTHHSGLSILPLPPLDPLTNRNVKAILSMNIRILKKKNRLLNCFGNNKLLKIMRNFSIIGS